MKSSEKKQFIRQWRVEFWNAGEIRYIPVRALEPGEKIDIVPRKPRFIPKDPPVFECAIWAKFPETADSDKDAKVVGKWADEVKRASWPNHMIFVKIQRMALANA